MGRLPLPSKFLPTGTFILLYTWQVIIHIKAYLYNAVTKTEVKGEGRVEEWAPVRATGVLKSIYATFANILRFCYEYLAKKT